MQFRPLHDRVVVRRLEAVSRDEGTAFHPSRPLRIMINDDWNAAPSCRCGPHRFALSHAIRMLSLIMLPFRVSHARHTEGRTVAA